MEENIQPMEVLQPSALHALERAQIDTQVATAHQYPRSLEQFRKRALSMATLDEETADSCIYVRPVGKKLVNGRWQEEYAEGASIRMAEIVAASYGNLRVAARVIEQTERYVKCEGVCHDLESNVAVKAEAMEPTVKKDGTPYSEGMRAVVAKACLSKALRDATFRVVPRALCKTIYDAAKKVAAGQGKPLEERRKKAAAWIASRRIEEARVFAALGVNGWSEVTEDHLLKLTGLKTAIQDGEVQPDEAFPPIGKAPEHAGPVPHTPEPPKTAPKPTPKPPVKTTQDKPQPEKATEPPPAPSDASQEQKPAEATVSEDSGGGGQPTEQASESSEPPKTDEQAEAEAGLAPETPGTNATGERDSFLKETEWDSDACKSVKLLSNKSGVSGDMLRAWLISKKLMKEGQKLHELATSKMEALNRNWNQKLPEIRMAK